MKEKILYSLWGCMFLLCAGLGFVPHPTGAGKVLLILTSLIFFLPGTLLLLDARKTGNRKAMLRIRLISILSLLLTALLLILNFLSVNWSPAAGRNLYQILVLVSSPMVCSQYWVLSLFLWACLLTGSFRKKS